VKFLHGFSAGEAFELLRPAAFLLAALLSTWVLASTRRRGFSTLMICLWTVGTLIAGPVIFPLYVIYLLFAGGRQNPGPQDSMGEIEKAATQSATSSASDESQRPMKMRWALPFLYLLIVIAAESLIYYRDRHSVDAYLARANTARLMSTPDKAIAEYRAALRLEDDPHTHNLLGIDLAATKRWDEALKEFRAAQTGGEPDPMLSFRLGNALSALGRNAEAETEYRRFLMSQPCEQSQPDARCDVARKRVGGQLEDNTGQKIFR
jgi:tetratricopeptide (TPR) repeat protein